MKSREIAEFIIRLPTWLVFCLQYLPLFVTIATPPNVPMKYLFEAAGVSAVISLVWVLSFLNVMRSGIYLKNIFIYSLSIVCAAVFYLCVIFGAVYYAYMWPQNNNLQSNFMPPVLEFGEWPQSILDFSFLIVVSSIAYMVMFQKNNAFNIGSFIGRIFLYTTLYPLVILFVNRHAKKVLGYSRA